MQLTQQQLHRLMIYDPQTGVFIWIVSRGKAKPGKRVGTMHHQGYMTTTICGREYGLHRLAWLYVHGAWPKRVIDHINGDRADNRIANLRDVNQTINQQNRRLASATNKSSGLLGVTRKRGRKKYEAGIQVSGKSRYLGTFGTAEEAHAAYIEAKRLMHDGMVA